MDKCILEPEQHYEIETVTTCQELIEHLFRLSTAKGNWVFRGHNSSAWDLTSTFERNFLSPYEISSSKAADYEANMIRDFKRHSRIYFNKSELPEEDHDFEWLALMQHYGVPTRLIDWTYSSFIASYFALTGHNPKDHKHGCAIWALHSGAVDHLVIEYIWPDELRRERKADMGRRSASYMNKLLGFTAVESHTSNYTMVHSPFSTNRRQNVQQGVFMASSSPTVRFESALIGVFNAIPIRQSRDPNPAEAHPRQILKKVVCKFSEHELRQAIELLRRMGLTAASIYPDIGPGALARMVMQNAVRLNFNETEHTDLYQIKDG